MTGKCECCERTRDLRLGHCFDCAEAESVIQDGTDMSDIKVAESSLDKLKVILRLYRVTNLD